MSTNRRTTKNRSNAAFTINSMVLPTISRMKGKVQREVSITNTYKNMVYQSAYKSPRPRCAVIITTHLDNVNKPKAISRNLSRVMNRTTLIKYGVHTGLFIVGCITSGFLLGMGTVQLIYAGVEGFNQDITMKFDRLETLILVAIGHQMKKGDVMEFDKLVKMIAFRIKQFDSLCSVNESQIATTLFNLEDKGCLEIRGISVELLEKIEFRTKA